MPKLSNTNILKKQIIKALEQSLGVVTVACKNVGIARQTAYWILRKSGMPYTMIAETMGKKCHASPIYGYKSIEIILELDMKNGYAPCVRKAFKHYKDFYKKYTKVKMKRKIEELENAF